MGGRFLSFLVIVHGNFPVPSLVVFPKNNKLLKVIFVLDICRILLKTYGSFKNQVQKIIFKKVNSALKTNNKSKGGRVNTPYTYTGG